ncbi:MAG: hypothetical protein AAF738_09710 [Bacteroidota bacterium]
MDKPNVYVRTLQLGAQDMEGGTTFNAIRKILQEEYYQSYTSVAYRLWFFDNFYCEELEQRQGSSNRVWVLKMHPECYDAKAYLKGDAYLKLLEWEQMQQREKIIKASAERFKASIAVAIAAFLLSAFLAIKSSCERSPTESNQNATIESDQPSTKRQIQSLEETRTSPFQENQITADTSSQVIQKDTL